jgi:hypothetical protein
MNNKFPFRVQYPRTGNWWNGDWRDLSNWCSASIGECAVDWEYIDKCFAFNKARDKTLFLLRWS